MNYNIKWAGLKNKISQTKLITNTASILQYLMTIPYEKHELLTGISRHSHNSANGI